MNLYRRIFPDMRGSTYKPILDYDINDAKINNDNEDNLMDENAD